MRGGYPIFAVLRYAKKSGMRTDMASFSDLTLRTAETPERPYFTSEQVNQIVRTAKEPYKTMFALTSLMGPGAGELLALAVSDLDFERKTIRVNKSADDRTRVVRQPKTKKSVAMLPMHRVWKPCCGIISSTTGKRIRANCSSLPQSRKASPTQETT
jgi:integrase